ncbi:MAG: histidine kinase [Gammaproteobacteria bacterium]|nr:histidine kinase [Gammaproteobacteria bacterium]
MKPSVPKIPNPLSHPVSERPAIPDDSINQRRPSLLCQAGLFWPSFYLTTFILLATVLELSAVKIPWANHLSSVFLIAALLCIVWFFIRLQHGVLGPLARLRTWAQQINQGKLQQLSPPVHANELMNLSSEINHVTQALQGLQRQVDFYQGHNAYNVSRESRSLETLYDIATSINNARDIDELLTHFLYTLKEVMQAEAVCVRLVTHDNQLRMVGSVGLNAEAVERERLMPISLCQCGYAVESASIQCQKVIACHNIIDSSLADSDDLEMVAVPLQYHGNVLGIYNLYLKHFDPKQRKDLDELFDTIGQHLAVAIEKAQLETEAQRHALMDERTLLSHELHDSLAQTLASLRLQSHAMAEQLKQGEVNSAEESLQRIKQGVEKGNFELRELLSHFRTPMDERGLTPAIEDTVNALQRDTGIKAFFQDQSQGLSLPPNFEVQVLHIVQEALSNVRRHSQAQTVRVLLKANPQGAWHFLIEDDGVGMCTPEKREFSGDHIGLSVMTERAKRLGGELTIESELGEGTRIELDFECPPTSLTPSLSQILKPIQFKPNPMK